MKASNLIGQTFGYLTVISKLPERTKEKRVNWLCLCICKKETTATSKDLNTGRKKSCGCMKIEMSRQSNTKHGYRYRPEYMAYRHAKMRCNNPSNQAYENYGARGIQFKFISFEEFIEHIGDRPSPEHSLDRKDVNGHYEIGNVRWATAKEQGNNTRFNRYLAYNEETLTIAQWTAKLGYEKHVIRNRLNQGWTDVKKILFTKPGETQRKYLTHKDETKSMAEWDIALGFKKGTVRDRIARGWSVERALETPVRIRSESKAA